MKKLLSTILILSVFCTSFVGIQPKALKATRYYYGLGTQTTSDGKWAYIIPNPQKQREAVIVHYNGTDTNIIIPETVNGKTVIGVGDLYDEYISNKFLTLFNDDLNVQTVTLPKTVRIIKDYSYGELGSDEEGWEVGFMTYTPIPNTTDFTPSLSKKSITDFYVDIENPYLSAEDGILYSNDKSTLFRFPAGKKTTEFTLPETVQTASLYAFANTQLKKVNFSNVTKVSPYLFYKANIETVTGLENISSLSEAAFYKSAIKDFPYMPKARIIYDYAFFNCDNLTNVNIPLRTDWVGKYSFFDCQNIETVDFGKLMLIGSYAFSGCSKIEEVHLPDTCDIISDSAFKDCTNLKEVHFRKLDRIGQTAFYNCKNLEIIGEEAFNTIEATEIQWNAFEKCESLKSIYLRAETINSKAFLDCTALEKIYFFKYPVSIDSSAFNNTAYVNKAKEGVVYINELALCYKAPAKMPTGINIKAGTKHIAEKCLYNLKGVQIINLPSSVVDVQKLNLCTWKELKRVYIGNKDIIFNEFSCQNSRNGTVYYIKPNAYYAMRHFENDKSTYKTNWNPDKTKSVNAVGKTKSTAKITWKKQGYVSGYEVYMKTSKNGKWKKVATLKGSDSTSYTQKGLSKNKTYYFRVRAYKTVYDKTYYGAYSTTDAAKTKKK